MPPPPLPSRAAAILAAGLLTLQLAAGPAAAPTQQSNTRRQATVRINDGTTIRGTVRELKDGVYTIETDSIGIVTVSAQRILGISYETPAAEKSAEKPVVSAPLDDDWGVTAPAPDLGGAAPAGAAGQAVAPPAIAGSADMQQLMQQMLGNPEIMKMVEQLGADPNIQKMVEDPQLLKAIEGGDFVQMLRNPAIRQLMDNETVKQITEEVKSGPATPPPAIPAAE